MRYRMLSLALTLLATPAAFAATDCTSLKSLKLAATTVVTADTVPAGAMAEAPAAVRAKLPAFCRVTGVIRPVPDSEIRFEVWMPQQGWNDRLLNVGNGGFAGSIGYGQMMGNLQRGYATAGTDAGHQADGEDASWAYGHPEKVADFGYRAVHLMTLRSKDIVKAFYAHEQKKAYFDACSDGGREALMEAQRFPEDYDGILAGAPANNWAHMLTGGVALIQATQKDPAAYISALKLPAIHRASLAACDALDGVKDGVVSDPAKCHFDPAVLQCKTGEDTLACLTPPQVQSLRALYAGGKDAQGNTIFPGLAPGDEEPAWRDWVLGKAPGGASGNNYGNGYFRYMVLHDPAWQALTADIGKTLQAAMERTAKDVDSTNPDLTPFVARGGKLLMYHGWNDPAISPWNSISYYGAVQKAMGAQKTDTAVRLYMVPGMEHCAGGPGPNNFGQLSLPAADGPGSGALDKLQMWVEDGKAPGIVLAVKQSGSPEAPVRTVRPLCPYPQQAKYDGKGDPNVPGSFTCTAP